MLNNKLNVRLVFLMFAVLLVVSGCSDDDPASPPVQLPEGGYLATSPDSLMALWETALSTMDSTMYSDMYDQDFRFHFSVVDTSEFHLSTDYMTRDETVQTGWNMFSGQEITNWQGVDEPGVARIIFQRMTRETPWEIVAVGSEPPTASARFSIQINVERGFGDTTLMAAGSYDFFAGARDTVLADGTATRFYRLTSMVAVNPDKIPGVINTWGGVHVTYMTNESPQAALEVSDIGGSPLPVYHCDASGSGDTDSGLHPAPYRWQFESGDVWTDWTENHTINHSYQTPGDYTITVEVRDRWGLTDTAGYEVTVIKPELPFPDSPDQLMANFKTIYESMDVERYLKIMHPDFQTILQEETIIDFPDVGPTLDVTEETRIHERMFSGEVVEDPSGNLVPGVRNIRFSGFRAQDAWKMSPEEDIIPNAEWAPFEVNVLFDRGQQFSTLKVGGMIKFYVTSSDSLHEGVTRKYYQMIGQVDLTGGFKSTEEIPWGSIKALWH
ncbi:MAG: PKD domain-containing protein [Candidatus Krumholzibacteria bacterium]|nr:PKD domain-containing protein [Candidatus Krumholzibacteria bacterium]